VPSQERPRLETERLLLRPPVVEDASAAAELLTDPEVMRFLGGVAVTAENAGDVVEKWIERWEQNDAGPFIVERRSDGRFLGRAGILVWDTRTWTLEASSDAGPYVQPELGWALARAAWGNGYATEAARAVREWARGERGIGRLVSLIAPGNVASQRVAQRLGASPGETVKLFGSDDAVVWVHPNT
jgi:RimJ/RimL family protein N-acetyltransferase